MDQTTEAKQDKRRSQRLTGGIILILVGMASLLSNWLDLGSYLVLLVGLVLLVWGSAAHKAGLIIPGGVVSGVGLGILAMQGPWILVSNDQNAVFLLCFSLGWFVITLLTGLFTCRPMWWALIPGGIMAVLGGVVLLGGSWLSTLIWPLALIIIGLFLLVRWGLTNPKE